jgi:hypothetical protein
LTADPSQAVYFLKGVYFNAQKYKSTADCLTAAHGLKLPLSLCARK